MKKKINAKVKNSNEKYMILLWRTKAFCGKEGDCYR